MKIDVPFNELIDLGFKEQELKKVYGFCSVINPFFIKIDRVLDICAGKGLLSFLLLYNGIARESFMVDKKKPFRFRRLEKLFYNYSLNYTYTEEDIFSEDYVIKNNGNSLVVAIHACGNLTDRIIELSLKQTLPFAIMPCCHRTIERSIRYQLRNPPDPRLKLYKRKEDYFDLLRQRYIEEHGWSCYIREIDEKITPRNKIIIASPKPRS